MPKPRRTENHFLAQFRRKNRTLELANYYIPTTSRAWTTGNGYKTPAVYPEADGGE